MTINNAIAALIASITLTLNTVALAGVDTETDENSVILAGHDAVAYFTENAAIEGSAGYTAVHGGAIYYFKNAENRDTFNANPTKYAPQYGGYCALGAALGKKFDIDGEAFEVVDGKLFVNKNQDVYETWAEDKTKNIKKADRNWTKISGIAAADL